MPTILLTGFEPFGGASSNPSQELVEYISAHPPAHAQLITAVLPVAASAAPAQIEQLLMSYQPDFCVMLGLAEGIPTLQIERVAINLCDFRIADNSGEQLVDRPVVANGPAAYFASLPTRALCDACHAAGVPAELSLSAGAYLCNLLFYSACNTIASNTLPTRAGFIHLPATPALALNAARPIASMPLELMATGIRAMLGTLIGA